jgi:hypothetical protein
MAPIESGFYVQIRPNNSVNGLIRELRQRYGDYVRWVAPVHGVYPVVALLSGPEAALNNTVETLRGHAQCDEIVVSPWLCPKELPVLTRLKPYEPVVPADKVTRHAVMEVRVPRTGSGAIHELAGKLTDFEGVQFATVLWSHSVLLVLGASSDGKLALAADAVYNAAGNRLVTVHVTLCALPEIKK